MKKLILLFAVVLFAFGLFSCEPERTSEELLEENEIFNVDKKDIERPGDQGDG